MQRLLRSAWTWAIPVGLICVCLALGMVLWQRGRPASAPDQNARGSDWAFVVAEMVEGNARLRQEIDTLETQIAGLGTPDGGGSILQSLVSEVNDLRIANGQVEVSGPGVTLTVEGPIGVLDLQDLINELRNAGAEALALGGQRLVARSAIGTNGEHVTADGTPLEPPYRLEAIGHPETLETALGRPGGVVALLQQANPGVRVRIARHETLTLPVFRPGLGFVYARRTE